MTHAAIVDVPGELDAKRPEGREIWHPGALARTLLTQYAALPATFPDGPGG